MSDSENMFELFKAIKGFLKLDPVCIDNNVFRLHYKATVIILCVSSLMITAYQFFGDPIDCLVDKKIPPKVMNNYCWIQSTFTVVKENYGDEIYTGVGPYADGSQVKYYKYYQWISFVLFFQAILFYLPRYLWKTWEGGRLKMLVHDLNVPIVKEDIKNDCKKLLVQYFISHLHQHHIYAFQFFICEILNFINVVGQMYLMDVFLDGEFTTYGLDVVWKFTEVEPEERADPMSTVFPKVTKCTLHKYGPSGTIENVDGLCLLPLNIVSEKIYVILWGWFAIVSIVTGLAIIYRLGVFLNMRMRVHILRSRARLGSFKKLELVTQKCQFGDWFILFQLARNMDPVIYKEFIHDVVSKLNRKGVA